jgi:hypothetical protein
MWAMAVFLGAGGRQLLGLAALDAGVLDRVGQGEAVAHAGPPDPVASLLFTTYVHVCHWPIGRPQKLHDSARLPVHVAHRTTRFSICWFHQAASAVACATMPASMLCVPAGPLPFDRNRVGFR